VLVSCTRTPIAFEKLLHERHQRDYTNDDEFFAARNNTQRRLNTHSFAAPTITPPVQFQVTVKT